MANMEQLHIFEFLTDPTGLMEWSHGRFLELLLGTAQCSGPNHVAKWRITQLRKPPSLGLLDSSGRAFSDS